MPRVSQAHLDARRRGILDAARRSFVRDGFHATSMQDLLTEAGMSAGAFYRYFPSKDDLVSAIVEENLAALTTVIDTVAPDGVLPPLEDALMIVLSSLERADDGFELSRLAVQIWGEAMRSPQVQASCALSLQQVKVALSGLMARYRERGDLGPGASTETLSGTVLGLLMGFTVQRAMTGDVDAAGFRRGLRALTAAGR